MPAITATSRRGTDKVTVTETTLNGSDSFVYKQGVDAILTLRNATGGALSPVIDGDGGSTLGVPGLGEVDISGGFAVGSIAPAAVVSINLDKINAFLSGTIAINTGTGLVATLLEN